MRPRAVSTRTLLAALAMLAACWPSLGRTGSGSHAPDAIYHDGYEGIDEGPTTDADAARFLAQATFGPTSADIAHLRAIGYAAWLDEQIAKPASTETQYIDWWVQTFPDDWLSDDARVEAWTINALGTPDPSRGNQVPTDQLRQRVAYALSQIFVVSNNNGILVDQPWGLGNYFDLLARDAFGNFRTLLEDVTKNPVMGIWLTMIENQKADPDENIHPDENYAREVNQLFSIGLVQLHPDGTPVMSGGEPVPTYDQTAVRGFAAVFTGWNWNNTGCGDSTFTCCDEDTYFWCGPANQDDPPWMLPMQPVEAYHDNTSDKQLLVYPGVALPNGVLVHGGDAQAEMTAALDNIFHHPNVGPFIGTRLIRNLVTSNPSPAYVARITAVFNDNGQGVRGDLAAVVRAILLDPEARSGQWQQPDTFGRLREPLLRLTQMWRALDAQSASGEPGTINPWPPLEEQIGEAPGRSPTVFNFFKPDYSPPGELSDRGLLGPEFQIMTDTTSVATANFIFHQVFCNYTGSEDCWGADFDDTLQLDEARDAALAASDPGALVDQYSTLLMSGQMSPFMRSVIVNRLNLLTSDDYGSDLGRVRVQHALYLILNSPEYSVQK